MKVEIDDDKLLGVGDEVDVGIEFLLIMLSSVFLVEVERVEGWFLGCIVSIFMRWFVVNFVDVGFVVNVLLIGLI